MIKSRVFNNAKWIVICKAAQSVLQLIIGMLCARYLGPSNYGIINYAASIAAFALPIMQLGLQATLVQEFIESPDSEGKIMGTSLVMDLVSGLFCVLMIGGFVSVVNRGEKETLVICLLYSTSLIFRAFELFQCWFQYKLESKYPSVAALCAYLVVSVYKIYLLAFSKSVFWFAVVNSIEFGIVGIVLFVIYNKLTVQKLSFSFTLIKKLFGRSKYYILSAMMVTVFQNTDHIMLKLILGDAENGFYTAAITSATVCQFVYTAIVDSMRPVILSNKKISKEKYEKNISILYCIIIYMTLIQAFGFTVFAKLIIKILYGSAYMPSVAVLQVLVWFVTFSFMGAVRNVWILAEGKQSLLWKINLAGALINVIINLVLIPKYGALGAAVASLATQIFSNFVLGFIIKPLRKNNTLLINGLNPKLIFDLIKSRNV